MNIAQKLEVVKAISKMDAGNLHNRSVVAGRKTGRRLDPVTLLGFVRQVMSFLNEWDGRSKPTKSELQRIRQWWNESHDCCPEAVAMDIRMVYRSADYMRQLVNGEA